MDLIFDSLREAVRLLMQGNRYVLDVVLLSLRVSGIAVLLGVALGLPVGIAVGLHRFRGRGIVVALIHTGFALPPVVVGLFVYMLLSRAGPAGQLELLFTPAARHNSSSLRCVPEPSPRDMNGDLRAAMRRSASPMSRSPRTPAGSSGGPATMKSFVMTGVRCDP